VFNTADIFLSANGNDYKGEENVVKAFQDHFRKLATFSLQDKIDLPSILASL
jgi:N-acetyl-anhydromuramyl-L-alanine amidase AmpD